MIGTDWTPPIFKTIAAKNQGIAELVEGLDRHKAFLATPAGKVRRARLAEDQLVTLFRDVLMDVALADVGEELHRLSAEVAKGAVDPYTACEKLVAAFRAPGR